MVRYRSNSVYVILTAFAARLAKVGASFRAVRTNANGYFLKLSVRHVRCKKSISLYWGRAHQFQAMRIYRLASPAQLPEFSASEPSIFASTMHHNLKITPPHFPRHRHGCKPERDVRFAFAILYVPILITPSIIVQYHDETPDLVKLYQDVGLTVSPNEELLRHNASGVSPETHEEPQPDIRTIASNYASSTTSPGLTMGESVLGRLYRTDESRAGAQLMLQSQEAGSHLTLLG